MLTKKELDAIEIMCDSAEEQGDYNMKENRSDYTDNERKAHAQRVAAMRSGLTKLRQMAGRRIFSVTWRPDGGDEESFFYSGTKEASDRLMDAALRRLAGDDGALVENYVITHEEVPFTALPITEIGR